MLNCQFEPFPVLTTDRLLLRSLRKEDREEIFFLRSDPRVMKYINREPAVSITEADDFIQMIQDAAAAGRSVLWGIAVRENPDTVIGNICIWQIKPELEQAEAGYVLHPEYWGRGLMQESLNAVIDYGINIMNLKRIEACLHADNTASSALLVRCGFTLDSLFIDQDTFRGQTHHSALYSLTVKT